MYKVASIDGIPSKPVAAGSSDQIVLKNNTDPHTTVLTVGFTISNNIIAVKDNVGGE